MEVNKYVPHRKQDLLLCQAKSPHFDQVLRDLGDPLFTFVGYEVWPVDELFIDLSVEE
jgi:hypothetical protein